MKKSSLSENNQIFYCIKWQFSASFFYCRSIWIFCSHTGAGPRFALCSIRRIRAFLFQPFSGNFAAFRFKLVLHCFHLCEAHLQLIVHANVHLKVFMRTFRCSIRSCVTLKKIRFQLQLLLEAGKGSIARVGHSMSVRRLRGATGHGGPGGWTAGQWSQSGSRYHLDGGMKQSGKTNRDRQANTTYVHVHGQTHRLHHTRSVPC